MAMTWLDPMGGDYSDGGATPRNQRSYDPNNPNLSPALWGDNGGPDAPGTGTTPSGGPPVTPGQNDAKPFEYDWTQKPKDNALNYLATQLAPQKSETAVQGHASGSPVGVGGGGGGNGAAIAGMAAKSCCFIFLESLNGELPWYVRMARDTRGFDSTVRGYRWMSRGLVPSMRVWRLARRLVNLFMVRPLLRAGEHYYTDRKSLLGILFKPVVWFWLGMWTLLGLTVGKYERK